MHNFPLIDYLSFTNSKCWICQWICPFPLDIHQTSSNHIQPVQSPPAESPISAETPPAISFGGLGGMESAHRHRSMGCEPCSSRGLAAEVVMDVHPPKRQTSQHTLPFILHYPYIYIYTYATLYNMI